MRALYFSLSLSVMPGGLKEEPHAHTCLRNCLLFLKFITNVVDCISSPNPRDERFTLGNLMLRDLIVLPYLCASSRSDGLHRTWQRAGRGSSSEKNGPAKPCEGWPDPQTRRLEEETPTATSLPQGAHAVLEQGGFGLFVLPFEQPQVKKKHSKMSSSNCDSPSRPTLSRQKRRNPPEDARKSRTECMKSEM